MSRNRKVVAIAYYGRSGSVFLQSLFDGHPNCVTIPGCYIMGIATWYATLTSTAPADVVDAFCTYCNGLFDPKQSVMGIDQNFHLMGENQDQELKIDEPAFRGHLSDALAGLGAVDLETLFVAIHDAYARTVGMDPAQAEVIVFQLHSPHEVRARFLRAFDTKIAHIVREPVQAIYSHKRAMDQSKDEPYGLRQIVNNMTAFYPIAGFEGVSKAVRLEDLHTDPETVMRKLCGWIGLSWHDCLLASTFNGLTWHNLRGTNKVSGFNTETISKKHEDLVTDYDRRRFCFLFAKVFRAWGYPCDNASRNLFARFKVEESDRFGNLVKNRVHILAFLVKFNPILRRLLGKRALNAVPLL